MVLRNRRAIFCIDPSPPSFVCWQVYSEYVLSSSYPFQVFFPSEIATFSAHVLWLRFSYSENIMFRVQLVRTGFPPSKPSPMIKRRS